MTRLCRRRAFSAKVTLFPHDPDSDARVPRPEPPPDRRHSVDGSTRSAARGRRWERVESATCAPRDRGFPRDRPRFLGRRRRRDRRSASEETSRGSRGHRHGRLTRGAERGLPRQLRHGGKCDARHASTRVLRRRARARLRGGRRLRVRDGCLGKRPIRESSGRQQSVVHGDERARSPLRAFRVGTRGRARARDERWRVFPSPPCRAPARDAERHAFIDCPQPRDDGFAAVGGGVAPARRRRSGFRAAAALDFARKKQTDPP